MGEVSLEQPPARDQDFPEPHAGLPDLRERGVELLGRDQPAFDEDPAQHRPHFLLEERVIETGTAGDAQAVPEGCVRACHPSCIGKSRQAAHHPSGAHETGTMAA